MSIFSWFRGGSKVAEKTLDGITSGIDALVFTEEEKVQYNAKAQELWLDLQKTLANESSPRSVNRRYVSWSVISMMNFITVICVTSVLIGNNEVVKHIVELAKALWWGEAFVAVIAFYYGPHLFGARK